MDEIHSLRDRYGADLVASLFVARPADGTCGIAWTPSFGRYRTHDYESSGFSVVARSCERTDFRTFAHEIGHNQGALHDPYNSQRTCPSGPDSCIDDGNFPWRFGRCNTEQGWRTVMAYQSTPNGRCVQSTARFSSPLIRFRGTPTGDAARRDNRRVLLETARRVANFRQSQTEPPPPPPNSLHATLPYVAPAGGGLHPSLVRVLNDSAQPNTVQVTGYDDTGRRFGPVPLSIAAREAATLTSAALESGGSGFAGLGDGAGWWRLELSGERPFRAGMYYRTADGFMAELTAPIAGEQDGSGQWAYDVGFFNPGSNTAKVSRLRLANPNDQAARVSARGHLLIGRPHETGQSTCCYTDGIPGVDPCRSLHGIITVLRRFAPTADRLHRNAPFVHSIAQSGIGRRDPATVQNDGALRSRHGPRPRSAASGAGAGRASGLSRPCAIVTLFMKRRALEKVLRERGWKLLRHGGRHDIRTDGGLEEAVPRHTEIDERLARAILRRVKKRAQHESARQDLQGRQVLAGRGSHPRRHDPRLHQEGGPGHGQGFGGITGGSARLPGDGPFQPKRRHRGRRG